MTDTTMQAGDKIEANGRKFEVLAKGEHTYRLRGSRGGEWVLVRHVSGKFWTLISPALRDERLVTLRRAA